MTRRDKLAAFIEGAVLSAVFALFTLAFDVHPVACFGLWAYGVFTLYPTMLNGRMARQAQAAQEKAARELQQRLLERRPHDTQR